MEERWRVFISGWGISSLALKNEYKGRIPCSNQHMFFLVKCLTSTVGEQTKVRIEYNAFSLFNLDDVHISVPSEEAPLNTPNKELVSCWYDPGKAKEQSKLHWKIPAIDEAKRHGSIEFLVPGSC